MHGTFEQTETQPIALRGLHLRERVLSMILGRIQYGILTVTFPSGNRRTFVGGTMLEGATQADITIHDWGLLSRVIRKSGVGFAEGFLAGEWSTGDLSSLLTVCVSNLEAFESGLPSTRRLRLVDKALHRRNRNTRKGSRRNISFHYDLGNDFYRLWLDETMTYSSALFETADQSLAEAQQAKYRALADAVGIKPGDRVLEIGCGWGGFAEVAARDYGATVTGLTLSAEQLAYAEERIQKAGLSDRVDFQLRDYRDMDGQFDHIVSIEMLEAVGEAYWPQYFGKVNSLLKPGGKAGIQVITIEDHRFDRYRSGVDFIQKYIFPGGMLPSDEVFKRETANAGMALVEQRDFGPDYAETLRRWQDTFMDRLPEVRAMGFDTRFARMWQYYLAYCEAGFARGNINVSQYVIANDGTP